MSFLVRYPVGNTIFRDCQYWPTITREALRPILVAQLDITDTNEQNFFMDRRWPCPVSQAVLMHMAWKVREWKVDASSFTYTGRVDAGTSANSWTISGTLPELRVKPKRANPLRDVTDEQDLLGPPTDYNLSFIGGADIWPTLRNAGTNAQANVSDVALVATGGFAPNFSLPGPRLYVKDYGARVLGGYVIFDPITGLFYPPFSVSSRFEVLVHDPPNPENAGAYVEFYLLPVTPTFIPTFIPPFGISAHVQQGTLTIVNPVQGGLDILIPIGMLGGPAGRNPPAWPDGGTGSCNLRLTPISWWPYQNSAGDEVYDTDTGEIENDPFG